MTNNTPFKVWIKKENFFGNEDANREAVAEIEQLKRDLSFTDGTLNGAPAYVFAFGGADTAYSWFFAKIDEIAFKYNLEASSAGVSFEDNFTAWRWHKDQFISDPANKNTAYYKYWTESEKPE